MLRQNLTILALVFLTGAQMFSQSEDFGELIVKGKKQGVKIKGTENWLIPLGKYSIVEPADNLFIKIDPKTQLTEGIYATSDFTRRTSSSSTSFFGNQMIYEDFLAFEDGYLSIKDGSFTKPRYATAVNRQIRGAGAGYFKGNLIIGIKTDSVALYDLQITHGVDKSTQILRNVIYVIIGNDIYVANTKWVDPLEYNYQNYDMTSIDQYKINEGKIVKVAGFDYGTAEFESAANILNGYNNNSIIESFDYDQFLQSNYKQDSSQKYGLIHEYANGILFCNQYGGLNVSYSGVTKFDQFPYEFNGSGGDVYQYIRVDYKDDYIIITDFERPNSVFLYDDMGNYLIDKDGNYIYKEVPGEQKSGVYDLIGKKWIVPSEYSEILVYNNKLLAHKIVYSEAANDNNLLEEKHYIDVFNQEGVITSKMENFDEVMILKELIPNSKVTKVQGTYSLFEVTKDNKTALFDLMADYFSYSFHEVSSFQEGYIPATFNCMSNSYITYCNDKFFINKYDVEMGVNTRELKESNSGYYFVNDHEIGFHCEFQTGKENQFSSNLLSGIRRLDQYHVVILNNTFSRLHHVEMIDEYGMPEMIFDEFGNQIMTHYFEVEGYSKSGLWDLSTKQWLINPEYFNIIPTAEGYTCIQKTELINGELITSDYGNKIINSTGFYPIKDSLSLDLIDKQYKNTGKSFDYNGFISDPNNIGALVEREVLGECIYFPKALESSRHIEETNLSYWFKSDAGYSVVSPSWDITSYKMRISKMEWVYETTNRIYGVRNDSLFIVSKSLDNHSVTKLRIGKDFRLDDFGNSIIIAGDVNYKLLSKEDGVIEMAALTDTLDFAFQIARIDLKGDELICNSFQTFEGFQYLDMDYDPYYWDESQMTTFKTKADFVWKRKDGRWNIIMNANSIDKYNFGYVVSNNLILDGLNTNFVAYNKGMEIYNLDFQKVEGLTPQIVDFAQQLEGHSDYTIIRYSTDNMNALYAIFDKNGEVLAKDFCEFSTENNVFTYSKCSDYFDPYEPNFEVDNEGNKVVYTLEIR